MLITNFELRWLPNERTACSRVWCEAGARREPRPPGVVISGSGLGDHGGGHRGWSRLNVTGASRALLYGVAPTDPPTYGLLAASLAVVLAFAAYLPARRAARVDPMVTLRQE